MAPPPMPARAEPVIADAPREPPAPPNGRLVLDTEGGSATVSRVTETSYAIGPPPPSISRAERPWTRSPWAPVLQRHEELLCVTPCTVDLRQGAHQLVFRGSEPDGSRASTADVVVTSKTTVVRHAVGREPRVNSGFAGGILLAFLGGAFTVMGGVAAAAGSAFPARDADGSPSGARTIQTIGFTLLGLGVAMGTTGGILIATQRPVEQAGSTTLWRRDGP